MLKLLFVFVPFALGLDLSKQCPKYFEKKTDGLCYYQIPYQSHPSKHGFRKAIPISKNGLHPQKIDLGRLLFFDPILSDDQKISCAHCHHPQRGFSDGRAVSEGVYQRKGERSAPSLWNTAFYHRLLWDGRAITLKKQALLPLLSPSEMGNTEEKLLERMNKNLAYRNLFNQIYFSVQITMEKITDCLAEFQSTLVSLNSRYDKYIQGDHRSLTKPEIAGLQIFRSFVTRCTECHEPPLFTNFQNAVIGAPEKIGSLKDRGVMRHSGDKRQKGAFRIPTLRNITLTAPYMHSGSLHDLNEVIRFYNLGGGRASGINKYIHWHIRPMGLSPEEQNELVAFLNSLNDQSAVPKIPDELPSGLIPVKEIL